MSNIISTIKTIKSCDSLHIVEFDFFGQTLSMMSLDLNKNLKIGTKVNLMVKSSHIAIAKNFIGEVSYSNKLDSKIVSIDNGELLSSIELNCNGIILESIITVNSSKRMDLKVGDDVIAFIKASELSIGNIIND